MKKILGALAVSTALLVPSGAQAQDALDNVCPTGNPAAVGARCANPDGSGTQCLVWVYVTPLNRDDADGLCVSRDR